MKLFVRFFYHWKEKLSIEMISLIRKDCQRNSSTDRDTNTDQMNNWMIFNDQYWIEITKEKRQLMRRLTRHKWFIQWWTNLRLGSNNSKEKQIVRIFIIAMTKKINKDKEMNSSWSISLLISNKVMKKKHFFWNIEIKWMFIEHE